MKLRFRQSLVAVLLVVQIGVLWGAREAVAAQRQTRVSDYQVRQVLGRIDLRWNTFRRSLQAYFNQNRVGNNLAENVTAFEAAKVRFRDRLRTRVATTEDVREMLNPANGINRVVSGNRIGGTAEQNWLLVRSDLDLLSNYYNVGWNWDTTTQRPGGGGANALNGTYRLNLARSDDAERVARRVTAELPAQQQERVRNMIMRRFTAPDMLALQREGRNVSVASSLAPVVTFEADGRPRSEQTRRGRTVETTASLVGDQLVVSTRGERGSDYRMTFDPVRGGPLTVTRQLDIESLNRPVEVHSSYDRVSSVAQLDLYRGGQVVGGGGGVITDETQLIATLNERLSTTSTRSGDRFTMTVRSPSRFEGAVIEGYVGQSSRSGRLTGSPELALNFERIRLRNGTTEPFDGYIESVRAANGDDVRVDNEGVISERNGQTRTTVTRTGIGAALGALLGAIVSGGDGAAIGAGVGAGAGAGSVFIRGRDDMHLTPGTEFSIRAIGPRFRAG